MEPEAKKCNGQEVGLVRLGDRATRACVFVVVVIMVLALTCSFERLVVKNVCINN